MADLIEHEIAAIHIVPKRVRFALQKSPRLKAVGVHQLTEHY